MSGPGWKGGEVNFSGFIYFSIYTLVFRSVILNGNKETSHAGRDQSWQESNRFSALLISIRSVCAHESERLCG